MADRLHKRHGPVPYFAYDRARRNGEAPIRRLSPRSASTAVSSPQWSRSPLRTRDGLGDFTGYANLPPLTPERLGYRRFYQCARRPVGQGRLGVRPGHGSNRGYLCLQVNFRGSTGYGKAFVNAGDREWGVGRPHRHVAHAVAEGWSARSGSQFTAGLMAVTRRWQARRSPGIYCCAWSTCRALQPRDPDRDGAAYWAPMIAQFHRRSMRSRTSVPLVALAAIACRIRSRFRA